MSSIVKVAVGLDGKNVLGEGRAKLLSLIGRTGSLRKAAREMGMSYRYAWGMIKRMEEQLDEKLVVSERGGARGGRTLLTGAARELLHDYETIREGALKGIGGGLLRVMTVLLVRDAKGRFAVRGGALPREDLQLSSSPEEMIDEMCASMALSSRGVTGPRTLMDEGALLLVYSARSDKQIEGSFGFGELAEKDQNIVRLFYPA